MYVLISRIGEKLVVGGVVRWFVESRLGIFVELGTGRMEEYMKCTVYGTVDTIFDSSKGVPNGISLTPEDSTTQHVRAAK